MIAWCNCILSQSVSGPHFIVNNLHLVLSMATSQRICQQQCHSRKVSNPWPQHPGLKTHHHETTAAYITCWHWVNSAVIRHQLARLDDSIVSFIQGFAIWLMYLVRKLAICKHWWLRICGGYVHISCSICGSQMWHVS